MTAARLLRLYPREWRTRYGDEFLATVGDEPLRFQQTLDIVSGAIDAWLSADVRRGSTQLNQQGAVTMPWILKAACARNDVRFTKRDSLIGASVMIGASALFVVLATVAKQLGLPGVSNILLTNSFLIALMLSMPFTFMKGQPWRAQVALCGGTILTLIGISALAMRF